MLPGHCGSALVAAVLLVAAAPAAAQSGGRQSGPIQEANRLDSQGKTREARAIFQKVIDTATNPATRAAAQRSIAMSYGFDHDCANAVKYEEMVIAYWVTREQAEPQNAHYQQGEMANEAARICIDAGNLEVAERYYRKGSQLGLRRGNAGEANRQVAEARRILDSDTTMARAQERFFPYLAGYVALYLNDPPKAEAELTRALAIQGNATDPFMQVLMGMTHEKMGHPEKANERYHKAYDLAGGHNPPAAFSRPFARKKLGLPPGA